MNRKEIVLVAMAPANRCQHSPVQMQKLLFLIDQAIPEEVNGPIFDFQPYNYGPFDKAVYETLEELANEGLVTVIPVHTWREYLLTEAGQREGDRLLQRISQKARDYIQAASQFVRELSFTQLVSAIYKAYPEMRANSVFQEQP